MIQKSLEKKSENRYASARELRQEFLEILSELPDDQKVGIDLGLLASESPEILQPRFEATQRLGAIMQTSAQAVVVPSNERWKKGSVVATLVVGALLAWLTRPGDPLAIGADESRPPVPRKPTAEAQYVYASLSGTESEELWTSVQNYFPMEESSDNAHWGNRASQQLYRYYAKNEMWRDALSVATRLAELEPSASEFQKFGVGGQAIAFYQLGELERAKERLTELVPLNAQMIPDDNLRQQLETLREQLSRR